jgi:hypothetical protein
MSRKFIAAIVAGSIAITGFASAPANASDRDIVRFLAGATALVIIGKAISDDRDRRHQPQIITRGQERHEYRERNHTYHSNNIPKPDYSTGHSQYRQPDQNRYRHNQPRVEVKPRPLPRRVQRDLLPNHCIESYRTRQGTIRMYGERCLSRSYRQTAELPRRCKQEIRTRAGILRGYSQSCLYDDGWMNRR